jgi:beta-lactam-binding protein with PASTA domain
VALDIIPNTIGLPTDEAIEVARAAGLDWTVRCNQDPQQPEGIVDQEPPAGTEVAPGSAFTMFSARIQDCR